MWNCIGSVSSTSENREYGMWTMKFTALGAWVGYTCIEADSVRRHFVVLAVAISEEAVTLWFYIMIGVLAQCRLVPITKVTRSLAFFQRDVCCRVWTYGWIRRSRHVTVALFIKYEISEYILKWNNC